MRYIAALDYDHLDNGVFLTTLARSLSQQQGKKDVRPIFVHGDSAYTERIIQTGVMRDEATIRSIKDLNNRLVALFADQGVSTIGMNPSQRNFITLKDDKLQLDHTFFDTLPHQSVLLLSTLVWDVEKKDVAVIDLKHLMTFLYDELSADHLFIFSKSDESEVFTDTRTEKNMRWSALDEGFRSKHIPGDFWGIDYPVRLTTARDFNQIPNLDHSTVIK